MPDLGDGTLGARVGPPADRAVGAAPTPTPDEADRDHVRALARERRARVAKIVAALVLLVILAIFIITNANTVPVNFVFAKGKVSLILVIFVSAVLGGLVGYLVGRPGKGIRFHRAAERRRGTGPPAG